MWQTVDGIKGSEPAFALYRLPPTVYPEILWTEPKFWQAFVDKKGHLGLGFWTEPN